MCYTGECPYERDSGPDAGECLRPGDEVCPWEEEMAKQIAAEAEEAYGC